MKVAILNGNPASGETTFDSYLDQLSSFPHAGNHAALGSRR